MGATTFLNLRARGTLTVVGLATLATAAITTLTVTTGTFTTANIRTLSGSLVNVTNGSALINTTTLEATTVSGGTLRTTAGGVSCTTDSCTIGTVNATAVRSGTMSGTKLELISSSGSGGLSIKDSGTGTNSGSVLCMDAADGTLTVCALSGGILDCNSFQSKVALCP